jgi:tetratricopeptide (TPR) repeat protein
VGKSDWYTRSTWTDEDAEAFWSRVRRTRKPQMAAQYIRVQAETLEKQNLVDPASMLLERILAEYPEAFDLAQVHHQLASCREKRGRIDEAIRHLRSALEIESQHLSYQTRAWLSFGRIAAEHSLRELYPEFLAIAEAKASRPGGIASLVVFPLDRYILSSVLAIIARDSGDHGRARDHALNALAAADLTHSGFRYHPTIGLVRETDTTMYRDVVKIAGD